MTDQSYLKKRCTEDLKSFNTALIKYRNDFSTNTQPKNNNLQSKSIEGTEEQEKLQESPMNIIQAPTVLHHNNNNNNKFSNYYNNRRSEGKLLSPPHSVDYSDLSLCCNSVAEGGMNRVQEAKNGTNYGQSPLIRNRFSNSSPSVFYGSTTVTNGHNNNGYYKPRYTCKLLSKCNSIKCNFVLLCLDIIHQGIKRTRRNCQVQLMCQTFISVCMD